MVNMRMGLQMKMSQQLIMTPQLQQAIKLLQLSRQELEELIEQSLIENPTLEKVEPGDEAEEENKAAGEKKETDAASDTEEFDPYSVSEDFSDEQTQLSVDDEWQNYIESGAGVIQESRQINRDSDDDSNPLEATVSHSTSLNNHLLWQLDMSNFNDAEYELAQYIIGNIDDDGYLSVSLREMLSNQESLWQEIERGLANGELKLPEIKDNHRYDAHHTTLKLEVKESGKKKKKKAPILDEEVEIPEETWMDSTDIPDEMCAILETVLEKIQQMDPPGVGARDLQECLQLQLLMTGLGESLAFNIIRDDMKLLEQKDLQRIARHQKHTIEETVAAYQTITELEPKPGRPFSKDVTQFVIPDVYIYKRNNEYVISLNQDSLPKLRISPYYNQLAEEQLNEQKKAAKPKSEEEDLTSQYLVEKIKSGEWLMKSIEQRQKTIYKVAQSILKHQKDFFDKGIDYLRPMVLKDVAEDIDVHESTVSRITTNKYVHTPQGIFELKYFFTSGIVQGDGDVISSKKIKDHIQKLVDSENPRKPYTDIQIAEELEKRGSIKVARRTVAKYREALNILPSNKRKKLF